MTPREVVRRSMLFVGDPFRSYRLAEYPPNLRRRIKRAEINTDIYLYGLGDVSLAFWLNLQFHNTPVLILGSLLGVKAALHGGRASSQIICTKTLQNW